MLQAAHIATRLPVRDLDRACAWYSEKLGLDPVEERSGGLLYPAHPARSPSSSLPGRRPGKARRWRSRSTTSRPQ
jgi:catechol 2,3-dioxygenase-like lactoylglutathione lyase family enzyme